MEKKNWSTLKNIRKATKKTKKKDKKENEKQEAKQEIDPQEAFRGFAYEKIKQVFDITTVNGDIYINVDNVFPLMKTLELDPKDETVLDMVRTACIETFGDMDPVEFDQAVVEQRRQKAEEPEDFENEIRTAFNLIDADQDGMISLQDVYQLMMGLGEMLTDEELMEMISSADYDNDGQISYKEFKRFLLDLSEEDMQDEEEEAEEEPEKEEGEENAEKDETNEAKEGEPQNESEIKPESEATKEKEESKVEENKSEETKIETEEAKPKLKEKKRSVLWGYTSQEKIKEEQEKKKAEEEKKKAEEEKKRLEEKKKAELAKAEEEKAKSETNGDENHDEQTSGITAVTIKHLDSIKEEGNSNENSPDTHQRKVYRPGSSRLARTRPNSSVTVSESVNEDSGIGLADSEHYNTDLEVTEDDGLTPRVDKTRTPSIGSRVTSARSRISSARSRVSSARSRAETIQTESTSIDLELSDIENVDDDNDDKDDDDASSITDPNVFHSPPSARQQSQIEKLGETLTYCEIVDPNAEIRRHSGFGSRSNSPQLSYKPYEDYLQYDQNFTGLKRAKSSNTLRRIQDIQQTLLKRQQTAPQLDMDAIRQANMSLTTKVRPKHNINGICTHLSIDLKIPLTDKTKITNYDKYMQRPKTAVPFIERQRKQLIRSSSFTTGRLVNEKNTDSNVNVIDLSKTLSSKNSGYYESPMMSLYHHGYKTVRPLARVMSAHLKSKSNSKEIEFNSISRQLEKGFIVRHERSRSETRSVTPSVKTKQTVINLEMEVQSTNKPKCKRFSGLSRIPREIPSWS